MFAFTQYIHYTAALLFNAVSLKTKQQNKSLPETGIEPRTLSIEIRLFNCIDIDIMGRNINKQRQICGPHFSCNCIWQFLIFPVTVFGSFLSFLYLYLAVSYISCNFIWQCLIFSGVY